MTLDFPLIMLIAFAAIALFFFAFAQGMRFYFKMKHKVDVKKEIKLPPPR